MLDSRLTAARLGRSSIWSLLDTGAAQLLNLLVFLVLAHFLAPSAFGLLAAALLANELFRTIAVEPILTAVTTRARPDHDDYTACFLLIAGVSLLGFALIFFAAGPVEALSGIDGLGATVQATAFLILTASFARTHEVWLIRQHRFDTLAMRSILSILLGGAVGIVLAIHGFGIWSLIAQQLVRSISALAFLWIAARWMPGWRAGREKFVSILRYARHVSATGIANFANQQSDVFFAITYLGAGPTGLYNGAKRLTSATNQILARSLNRVALPAFAELKADRSRLRYGFLNAVSLTSLATAPIFAGIALLSEDIVAVALGDDWTATAPLLAILCLPAFLATIGQYNHSIVLALDKPHWQTILTAIYGAANILLFLIVARYGIVALATAFAFRALTLFPLSFGAALYLTDIRWRRYLARIGPPLLASGIMVVMLIPLHTALESYAPVTRLFALPLAGAPIYLVSLLVFDRDRLFAAAHIAAKTIGKDFTVKGRS
ncbi:MAG: lipopolysaccharide biosynthesis protein [Pseudomonadota bacterium]